MRITSFILGLLGSLMGLVMSYVWINNIILAKSWAEIYEMEFTELINFVGYTDPKYIELAGWMTLICFVVAIIGATFTLNKPIVARWLLLAPAIAVLLFGLVDVIMGIGIVFLILAGIFSYIEAKQEISNTLIKTENIEENAEEKDKMPKKQGILKAWWNANKGIKS